MAQALRDAGLSGIKLHDPRHFYASGLIAAGGEVVTGQRSLGHAKATTLNTYARPLASPEDRTRKTAESIMSASLGQPPRHRNSSGPPSATAGGEALYLGPPARFGRASQRPGDPRRHAAFEVFIAVARTEWNSFGCRLPPRLTTRHGSARRVAVLNDSQLSAGTRTLGSPGPKGENDD
ncbi:hypothetical protein MTP03_11130 [Tsukamurella sp. PLM1]|nr:hypothetical protein MTP03_11130 [Tsukamurella sp. PLM1]